MNYCSCILICKSRFCKTTKNDESLERATDIIKIKVEPINVEPGQQYLMPIKFVPKGEAFKLPPTYEEAEKGELPSNSSL